MEQPRREHWNPAESDAARRLVQLANVQALVEEIAGRPSPAGDKALDRSARIGAAYEAALPIVQKRFDALAGETAVWAAAAAQALLRAGEARRAPATRLATELARAQREMEQVLGLG